MMSCAIQSLLPSIEVSNNENMRWYSRLRLVDFYQTPLRVLYLPDGLVTLTTLFKSTRASVDFRVKYQYQGRLGMLGCYALRGWRREPSTWRSVNHSPNPTRILMGPYTEHNIGYPTHTLTQKLVTLATRFKIYPSTCRLLGWIPNTWVGLVTHLLPCQNFGKAFHIHPGVYMGITPFRTQPWYFPLVCILAKYNIHNFENKTAVI